MLKCLREHGSCSRTGKWVLTRWQDSRNNGGARSTLHSLASKPVLAAANMALSDIVRLTVFLIDQQDVSTFVTARDRVMGDHKPGAIILIAKVD